MKKTVLTIGITVLLVTFLFTLTGCGNNGENEKKNTNTVEISNVLGKGKITLSVPKNDQGEAKYKFTTEKPETSKLKGTFYLETDNAAFAFSTEGFAYHTATKYKELYGEQKPTFDGYLAWIDHKDSTIRLSGLEKLDINGRKAIRSYCREGGSGVYTYFGYIYLVGVDDIYPGSRLKMVVSYKTSGSEAKEFDEETLAIINSLKVTLNQ